MQKIHVNYLRNLIMMVRVLTGEHWCGRAKETSSAIEGTVKYPLDVQQTPTTP